MHARKPAYDSIPALSAILDALDEGLLVVGPDNRVACVNRHLRCLLGIDRDAACEIDATHFLRWALVPRICEDSGRAAVLASLSDCSRAPDILCTLRLLDGREERFRCSVQGR